MMLTGLQIWDLFYDQHLFYGQDPDGKGYFTRAHLAELIGTLGPPPTDLLNRGKRSREFFDETVMEWHIHIQERLLMC